MTESESAGNLGMPVPVGAGAIEEELKAFWNAASQNAGETAVLRACSCNLIIVARDRREAAVVLPVLARVSEWFPHRSIVAYPAEPGPAEAAAAPIRAWIGAQCSLPVAGGPQVCSESIILESSELAEADLPNTVSSLLVPDLPVYVYWRSFRERERRTVEAMCRYSDVLIVDSHASKDDPEGRGHLLELLVSTPAGLAVRDMNWERLTPWRDLLAQFFDPPSARHCAREITRVEVQRSIAAPGSIPTRALLLTGWLVSRLGWRCTAARRSGDEWISEWQGASGAVFVRFAGHPEQEGEQAGISGVSLRTTEGGEFSVRRERQSACLTATTAGTGSQLSHSVPELPADEWQLLVRELSLSGVDSGFRAALKAALALEQRFRTGSPNPAHLS